MGMGDARGRWRQVEVRWGGRGRGADGRRFDVGSRTRDRLAATGFRATQAGDGLALTVTLTRWTRPRGTACSQPRVQRAATRFPWAVAVGVGETGGCATPGRSKERRRKFRDQKDEAQALANMSLVVEGRDDGG